MAKKFRDLIFLSKFQFNFEKDEPADLLRRLEFDYRELDPGEPCAGIPNTLFRKFRRYLSESESYKTLSHVEGASQNMTSIGDGIDPVNGRCHADRTY